MVDESVRVRDHAVEQLSFHWQTHLRPRLRDLSDDEYLWEPVEGCWSLRRRGESTAPIQGGAGEFVVEFAFPEPDPPPVTSIAWRLAHLIVGVFGVRAANHFSGPPTDYFTHDYAPTAGAALAQLDSAYESWVTGVSSMSPARIWESVGPTEGDFAEVPYIGLILHINREVIHHGAEILLLRDLFRATG